jgi:lysophospholipase L1-like esterase
LFQLALRIAGTEKKRINKMSEQEKNTLLMIGDSLVEWGDWNTLLPDLRIINRGVAGEHTEELSARLVREIDSIQEPDHILIMSGTNNLLMGSPYFPAILTGMLPRLKSLCPKSVITLNSIMPMRFKGLAEEAVTAINLELRDIAERNNCRFLDMVKPFTEQCLPITKPCFLNDGVHLATRGYQVWAGEIKRHFSNPQ